MSPTSFEKITPGVSGVTYLAIGIVTGATPHSFYASFGIAPGNDASLLSELRALGAGLAAFGGLMLAVIWRGRLCRYRSPQRSPCFLPLAGGFGRVFRH